jgi:hypothetical protein
VGKQRTRAAKAHDAVEGDESVEIANEDANGLVHDLHRFSTVSRAQFLPYCGKHLRSSISLGTRASATSTLAAS